MYFNITKLFVFLVFVFLNISFVDAVVINEIMYAPSSYLGGSTNEWVELYNPSNETVDVSGWVLRDKTTLNVVFLKNTSIEPQGYLIVAYKSEIFSSYYNVSCSIVNGKFILNNGGDLIELLNNTEVIDAVTYMKSWGAYNNSKTLSRKNASLIFDSENVFEGTPSPCAPNFKNTSADVRIFLDGDKLKVFPDDADVVVDYSVKSNCLGAVVSSGTTNQTSFDLDIDFGKVHIFANITHIGNYNDTNESNNFIDESVVLEPTTKTKRMRVWTDNNTYELNTTL
ncbi:MAG: lamin tail domain-containing protein, partial [Candidatus Aenigmarchaeota archaeon]|nr:lamin tail domain-containing protein [Candidatus Aenigmarchaeota archaeon]